MGQRQTTKEIRKYLEMNEKKSTTYSKFEMHINECLKFIAVSAYNRIKSSNQLSKLPP